MILSQKMGLIINNKEKEKEDKVGEKFKEFIRILNQIMMKFNE